MKTIYIIRHAKSDWEDAELHDIERPLAERGIKDAKTMADLLKTRGIVPDKMISSPALRAFSTCRIFCDIIGFDKKEIQVDQVLYFGNIAEIIKMVQTQSAETDSICIFGHNPTFSLLATILCDEFSGEMPTCSIVALQWNIEDWGLMETKSAKLLWFEYPKKNR